MEDDDFWPSPFLRLGPHVINMNKVARIDFADDGSGMAVIVLADVRPPLDVIRLRGKDAEVLRDKVAELCDDARDDDEVEFRVDD